MLVAERRHAFQNANGSHITKVGNLESGMETSITSLTGKTMVSRFEIIQAQLSGILSIIFKKALHGLI